MSNKSTFNHRYGFETRLSAVTMIAFALIGDWSAVAAMGTFFLSWVAFCELSK